MRARRLARRCTSFGQMQAVRDRIAAAARASSARPSDIALRWQRVVLQALGKLQCLVGKLDYAHIRAVLSDREYSQAIAEDFARFVEEDDC